MSATAATSLLHPTGLLDAFAEHSDGLGGQPDYRRERLASARAFLGSHPDLDEWMTRPVEARLVELRRRPMAWQLVAFAVVSGRCRADVEFLFAKNFGHSVARSIAVLFPADVERLRGAAERLGAESPHVAVREVLSLAVAFTGRPPNSLSIRDLDALCTAIDTTPRLTEAMRRGRRGHLFRLRRLLFEAGMVDLPAQHRREGGPATRQARLAVIPAPEIRRTLLAYLDVRATVFATQDHRQAHQCPGDLR
jgi:DNA-binding transcriptional ArsR family regulator